MVGYLHNFIDQTGIEYSWDKAYADSLNLVRSGRTFSTALSRGRC